MKKQVRRAIVKISEKHSKELWEISQFLDCSNLRALQFALSYVYDFNSTVVGRYWRATDRRAKNLYIPLSDSQWQNKEKMKDTNEVSFKTICYLSIDRVYADMSKKILIKDSKAWRTYIPEFRFD
jgi:hypothetical protein